MKQVLQSVSGGPVRLADVPVPSISESEVLVRTVASVLSAGTERSMTSLAQASLLAKARQRPDLVKAVMDRAKRDGVASAVSAVRGRMESDLPLGYSASGVVVDVGTAVGHVRPGQLVATGGAGRANHAEYQSVPALLCRPLGPGTTPQDGAFATVGAIALQGIRRAGVTIGDSVVVIGQGIVGQLTTRLLLAAGCRVASVDIDETRLEASRSLPGLCLVESGDDTTRRVLDWTADRGVDAVIVASGGRDNTVARRVPELCRNNAVISVVGDIATDFDRSALYDKELDVRLSRSYGPGRYERSYEDWGVDYPPEFVRWTEGRNMDAVLQLCADRRLETADLVTHRFSIDDATRAYELIESGDPHGAIMFDYPHQDDDGVTANRPVEPLVQDVTSSPRTSTDLALVGCGRYATGVLVPTMTKAGFTVTDVVSASGVSASRVGAKYEARVWQDADAMLGKSAKALIVATPHSQHARLTASALRAGHHVFCEKPLALTLDELKEVRSAWKPDSTALFVGFNRRWSPAIQTLRSEFAGLGRRTITYQINAGPTDPSHWYSDRREGGRLLGEACHFIDACLTIVGSEPTTVDAVAAGGPEELLMASGFLISMTWPDGSMASIAYSSDAPPSVSKERLEVLSSAKRAIVDDFRSLNVDGAITKYRRQDKGHEAQAVAFANACRNPAEYRSTSEGMLVAMDVTLRAAAALST